MTLMNDESDQRYDCHKCRHYDPDEFCLGCERESKRRFRLKYLEILKYGTPHQLAEHSLIPSHSPKQNGLLSLIWVIHWEYLLQNYPNAHITTINSCWCDGTYDEAQLTPDNPKEKYGDECIYRVHEIDDDVTICCCKGNECRRILKSIYLVGLDYPHPKPKEEKSLLDEPDSEETIGVIVDLGSLDEDVPKNYFPDMVREYVIQKFNPDDVEIDQIYCLDTDEYY